MRHRYTNKGIIQLALVANLSSGRTSNTSQATALEKMLGFSSSRLKKLVIMKHLKNLHCSYLLQSTWILSSTIFKLSSTHDSTSVSFGVCSDWSPKYVTVDFVFANKLHSNDRLRLLQVKSRQCFKYHTCYAFFCDKLEMLNKYCPDATSQVKEASRAVANTILSFFFNIVVFMRSEKWYEASSMIVFPKFDILAHFG